MTGPTPPGHGGLPGRLADQDRRIEELSRRSTQGPVCVVRLNANVSVAGDVKPVTQWKPTAEVDTAGIYHYNESGDTYWEMPHGGRFHIMVLSLWAAYGEFNANDPPTVATSVLLNSGTTGTPGSYAISQVSAFTPRWDTAYPLVCEDRVLVSGDRIRINFWAHFYGTVMTQQLQAFTHVVIRYLGSS